MIADAHKMQHCKGMPPLRKWYVN